MPMCQNIHNLPEARFNRNQLPNVKLERELIPLILYHLYTNIGYISADQIRSENIEIILINVNIEIEPENELLQYIYAKFYLLRKPKTLWNPVSKLMEMQFTTIKNSLYFTSSELLAFNDKVNCIDTGALIPQMSDIGFNEFAHKR